MKPRVRPQDSGVEELFRSKLKNIINLRHELVRLDPFADLRFGSSGVFLYPFMVWRPMGPYPQLTSQLLRQELLPMRYLPGV